MLSESKIIIQIFFSKEFNQYENKRIQQQPTYTEISLYKEDLADRDMEIVVKEAIDNKQCIGLYLGCNEITSIGASILAHSLNNKNNLKRLWLYDNQICDNGVYSLVKILSINNKILIKLDLGKNSITDEGIKHLVQMLKTNKTLTHLYLNQNEITDYGVKILTNAIQYHNTTIKLLFLSMKKLLTDLSVDYLLQMIQSNQSIKELRICDCSLSEKGKQRLKMSEQSKQNFKVYVTNANEMTHSRHVPSRPMGQIYFS